MKLKTNFKDMREAVVTIGKAVKKNMSPIEISLVKIEAYGRDTFAQSSVGFATELNTLSTAASSVFALPPRYFSTSVFSFTSLLALISPSHFLTLRILMPEKDVTKEPASSTTA